MHYLKFVFPYFFKYCVLVYASRTYNICDLYFIILSYIIIWMCYTLILSLIPVQILKIFALWNIVFMEEHVTFLKINTGANVLTAILVANVSMQVSMFTFLNFSNQRLTLSGFVFSPPLVPKWNTSTTFDLISPTNFNMFFD